MARQKVLFPFILCMFLTGCGYFTTYDSAKMLDAKEFEIGGMVGRKQGAVGSSEVMGSLSHVGAQFSYGFSKMNNIVAKVVFLPFKENFEYRYSYRGENPYSFVATYIAIGPKFALGKKEKSAFLVPVGVLINNKVFDVPIAQISPTFIFTPNPTDVVATNISLKGVWNIEVENERLPPFPAATLGCTISPKSAPIRITPEVGLIWYLDEFATSFGTSFSFVKRKADPVAE